jgi:hypothetical protein
MINRGVYTDDCASLSAEAIHASYGVDGEPTMRPPGQTGAGQLLDEDVPVYEGTNIDDDGDDDAWENLEAHVEAIDEAHANRYYEKVNVPKHENPFIGHPEMETVFHKVLAAARMEEVIPEGYGVLPSEWDDGTYSSYETIKSGRKGAKEINVALPDHIWRPRSTLWAQGLDILRRILFVISEADNQ